MGSIGKNITLILTPGTSFPSVTQADNLPMYILFSKSPLSAIRRCRYPSVLTSRDASKIRTLRETNSLDHLPHRHGGLHRRFRRKPKHHNARRIAILRRHLWWVTAGQLWRCHCGSLPPGSERPRHDTLLRRALSWSHPWPCRWRFRLR